MQRFLNTNLLKKYSSPIGLNSAGEIYVIGSEEKILQLDEVDIEIVHSADHRATAYLISSKDRVIQGILMDYWEV